MLCFLIKHLLYAFWLKPASSVSSKAMALHSLMAQVLGIHEDLPEYKKKQCWYSVFHETLVKKYEYHNKVSRKLVIAHLQNRSHHCQHLHKHRWCLLHEKGAHPTRQMWLISERINPRVFVSVHCICYSCNIYICNSCYSCVIICVYLLCNSLWW